jgi:hypothetical protein
MKKFKNMKKTLMILMAVALIALPTMAQQSWNNQQSVYGQQYRQRSTPMSTATYHNTTFHSTGSSMMHTGSSYSARPVINYYGSAVSNGGGPNRRRGLINWGSGDDTGGEITGGGGYEEGDPIITGGGGGGGIVTPDQGDDDDRPNGSPLGDAALPLLLLACAYLIMRATRTRAKKG